MEKVLVLKKILIVTEYFYPEEFKINEVAQEFKKKGYHVDILTNNPTYPHGKIFKHYKNLSTFWYAFITSNSPFFPGFELPCSIPRIPLYPLL